MYFDFARLSFHVPIRGLLCASPMSGTAAASTAAKKSGAIDVKANIVRQFIMSLLWLPGNAEENAPGQPNRSSIWRVRHQAVWPSLDAPGIIHLNELRKKATSSTMEAEYPHAK